MHRPPGNRNAGGRNGNGDERSRPPPLPDLMPSERMRNPSLSGYVDLVPGTLLRTLTRVYELGEKIGEGGMGAVFKAKDMEDGKVVVIKLVIKSNLRGMSQTDVDTALARFKREAAVAAGLNHPNVVKTLDLGFLPEGDPFIVMEHFPGDDIYKIFKRCVETDERGKPRQENGNFSLLLDANGRPLMSWEWLGTAMMEVCEGLNAAHVRKIMHRDIKPGNIMVEMIMGDAPLRPVKDVKILDFGLAKFVYDQNTDEELTRAGIIAGTLEFMAPEQVSRAQSMLDVMDHRVDIYALGAVMYRLLTGRSAFSPEIDGLMERMNEMPQPPSIFRPDLAADVDRIILTAMATKKEDRYPSAVEFKRAIAASLGYGTPQPARTSLTLAEVAPEIHRSKRGGVGKTIAALAAVAALGAGGYFAYQHQGVIKEKLGLDSKKADGEGRKLDEQKGYVVTVDSTPSGIPIFRVVKSIKVVKGKKREVEDEIFLGNTPLSTVLPPGEHTLRARKKWRRPKDMVVSPAKNSWKFRFY
ncbi:MAG: serine/threonine-protein kinase [Candidatus Micrarchaeota archaeon]